MKMVHEICEAMTDHNPAALLISDEIKQEETAWLAMLKEYVPLGVQDDFAAAVSNYAVACNAKGYEAGFLTAWRLVNEMNEVTREKWPVRVSRVHTQNSVKNRVDKLGEPSYNILIKTSYTTRKENFK